MTWFCTGRRPHRRVVLALLAVIAGGVAFVVPAGAVTLEQARARSLLAELVEIDTSATAGPAATRVAAERLAERLLAADFPADDVQVLVMPNGAGNLVARYRARATRREPVLLLAHLDVVEALRADWSVEPFQFLERDGYFYGRGVWDNKAGASLLVATFLRLKEEGFEPDRDLILAFTADEETEQASIQWLLAEHRPRLDAEYAINSDGGRVILREGRVEAVSIETSEKVYASYAFEAVNSGGHSSLPRKDNAIYDLVAVLERLRRHVFPVDLSETTRGFLAGWPMPTGDPQRDVAAALVAGRIDDPAVARLAEYPYLNAVARTTCVPTQLRGGHAENALPQTARAVVNCRILPQTDPAEIEATLRRLAASTNVTVEIVYPPVPSPPSPVDSEVFAAARELIDDVWPGVPLLPQMATGATDGLYVRNAGIPTYTVDFLAADPDDDRTHGQDERLRVDSYYTALDLWYRLLRRLATPPDRPAAAAALSAP